MLGFHHRRSRTYLPLRSKRAKRTRRRDQKEELKDPKSSKKKIKPEASNKMKRSNMLSRIQYYVTIDSLFLTAIYTLGHMIIAIICVMAITGATLELAMADAFIEPIINGVWFFVLHSAWKRFSLGKSA